MNESSASHTLSRDSRVDFLKTIGLFCIFLAHANPPGFVFQVRNFDVVLLVFLSGVLSSNVLVNNFEDVKRYWVHRLFRLLIPTWIFLLFFTSAQAVLALVRWGECPKLMTIARYFLLDGSYIWIIRVFLLTAFITPLVLLIKRKLRPFPVALLTIAVYSAYESSFFLNLEFSFPVMRYIQDKLVGYLIPYGLVTVIGIYSQGLSRRRIFILSSVFFLVFVGFAFLSWRLSGSPVSVQHFKYPPRLYFLSYGLAVSLFLYGASGFLENRMGNRWAVLFSSVAKNSLWLYFWQTLLLDWDIFPALLPFGKVPWYLEVWVLFFFAGSLLGVQKLVGRFNFSDFKNS
jgi:hypothetical protein